MHFSIPETQDIEDAHGSTFTVFNLHVNGAYHCSVRYSQVHRFNEQLKKEFGGSVLPQFPPKKLLSLTLAQLEDRRMQLEKYIQIISQNPEILASATFNSFLLSAQQDSHRLETEEIRLPVYLMNGHNVTVTVLNIDQTEDVLETVASQIELPDEFVYYFGLYLVRKEEDGDHAIVRRLQDFESPWISLEAANAEAPHRIVVRKSYWDSADDDDLMDDNVAMNLLYVQAVSDVERGWILASKEQHKQLSALQQKKSKKEFLRLARTLKYYGFIQLNPCTTDYPQPDCRVLVSAGNKELNFRVHIAADQVKEASFKVTRMRCWRITTTLPEASETGEYRLELAFEYLMSKDTLKWITITSEQAILISMCLQAMVDELILKKQNKKIKRPQDRGKRAAGRKPVLRQTSTTSGQPPTSPSSPVSLSQDKVFAPTSISGGPPQGGSTITAGNAAFDGITDADL